VFPHAALSLRPPLGLIESAACGNTQCQLRFEWRVETSLQAQRHFDARYAHCSISPHSVRLNRHCGRKPSQRTRQHYHAIFVAFALAHGDRAAIEMANNVERSMCG
jgi:hypothetical protein